VKLRRVVRRCASASFQCFQRSFQVY